MLKVIFAVLVRQSVITSRSGCCSFWFTCLLWKDRIPRDSANTKWPKHCGFKDCAWKIDPRFLTWRISGPLWLTWTNDFSNALEQSNIFPHTRLEPASHVRSMPALIDSLYQFCKNSMEQSVIWTLGLNSAGSEEEIKLFWEYNCPKLSLFCSPWSLGAQCNRHSWLQPMPMNYRNNINSHCDQEMWTNFNL